MPKDKTQKLDSENEGEDKKPGKRRNKKHYSFKRYISLVYKNLDNYEDGNAISKGGMKVLNEICFDLFDRIASESRDLNLFFKTKTLSKNEIRTATKLIFGQNLDLPINRKKKDKKESNVENSIERFSELDQKALKAIDLYNKSLQEKANKD